MPASTEFEANILPDLLPIYYKRLFPFDQYYKWLSYGNVTKNYFTHREFSYTLADDIYIRYQSFKDKEEMEKDIQKRCPYKIDIGAVYSFRPKDHRTVTVFTPMEKELVFDIDMTDYDEVRYCCSDAQICNLCWKYMTVAIEILDKALREDFGYKHILWVFSGRRGVHCWVCDAGARALSQSSRSALAEYLQVIRGGESQSKKVSFIGAELHPFLKRSETIILKYFDSICLQDQDILGTPKKWAKVLGMIPDGDLRGTLEKVMPKCSDSAQRWETIKKEWESSRNIKKKGHRTHLISEIMFQLVFPRLDINVSKGLNHLLKSPFSIHPKTGRVCVPIDPSKADRFDPLSVPTINQLLDEISQFDATNKSVDKSVGKSVDKSADKDVKIPEYKKTSMKEAMQVFENFLTGLSAENAKRRLEASDKKLDF